MSDEQRDYVGGYNPLNDNRDDGVAVADQFELLTKFSMEPNLQHYGYGTRLNHLNKNLLLTNLKREHGEPQEIQKLSRAITILSGHEEEQEVLVETGEYHEFQMEDKVIRKPIFVVQKIPLKRFERLEGYIGSKVFVITSTAAGVNAALLEKLKSSFLHKEQTIEDKTATQGGLWAKVKGRK